MPPHASLLSCHACRCARLTVKRLVRTTCTTAPSTAVRYGAQRRSLHVWMIPNVMNMLCPRYPGQRSDVLSEGTVASSAGVQDFRHTFLGAVQAFLIDTLFSEFQAVRIQALNFPIPMTGRYTLTSTPRFDELLMIPAVHSAFVVKPRASLPSTASRKLVDTAVRATILRSAAASMR